MRALLIVDVQNDFCPGGSLAVQQGDEIVPVINALMPSFSFVLASRDWHPAQTIHFEKWPIHCVADTLGAEYHKDLCVADVDVHLLKGTNNADDGYSAFEATNHNVIELLTSKGITEVYVCGLATDYCVRATALDAVKAGFTTFLISDASKGVELAAGDCQRALDEMLAAGVRPLLASQVLSLV